MTTNLISPLLRVGAVLVAALSWACVATAASGATYEVTVRAAGVARQQSIVTFRLPETGAQWRLRDERGSELPLQVTGNEGAFVLPDLKAGASVRFRLEAGASAAGGASDAVTLRRAEGKITARVGEHVVLSFQEEKSTPPDPKIEELYRRGGYIHPVFSPSGTLVTGDYPPDHYHHHGIWFAWVKTAYEGRSPDFWNVQDHLGRVDFKGVERFWSGAVHGGIVARFQSIDILAAPPKAVIDETWDLRVYRVGQEAGRPYWMFDLASNQRLLGESVLKLLEYRYGGIGIRGHRQWDGTGHKTRFLTSTGERDRIKAHESRAVWCHMGGIVDGRFTGIATLSHPENFRSPEPMRVNPKIPLLNFAPSQAGDWEMRPGRDYVWRYRFIVQDGEPDQAWIEGRWRDYAKPAEVTIVPLKVKS